MAHATVGFAQFLSRLRADRERSDDPGRQPCQAGDEIPEVLAQLRDRNTARRRGVVPGGGRSPGCRVGRAQGTRGKARSESRKSHSRLRAKDFSPASRPSSHGHGSHEGD